MNVAILLILVLILFAIAGVGLYFLWRKTPSKGCVWENRECNYQQGCINKVCVKDGKVVQKQCLKTPSCSQAPSCKQWKNIGCDYDNECMRQECAEDNSKKQCVPDPQCKSKPPPQSPTENCPTNTSLQNNYCYSVCGAGTKDMGNYCELVINNMKCPPTTIPNEGKVQAGTKCYKRKFDPKTGNCIPEWVDWGCDPKSHLMTQINTCTGAKKTESGSSSKCCPDWKVVGCDLEQYCTKLVDQCQTSNTKCICGSFNGQEYKQCCPVHNWGYKQGYLKNRGMNSYITNLLAGGYSPFTFAFNSNNPRTPFQPQKDGYLYMPKMYEGISAYLTLGSKVNPCAQSCGKYKPPLKVNEAYVIKFSTKPDTKWYYNRITGEIVDNLQNPTIKLSVVVTPNQAGENPIPVVAAIPYSSSQSNYDIWYYITDS